MSKIIISKSALLSLTVALFLSTALRAEKSAHAHLKKAQKHFQKGFKNLFEEMSIVGNQLVENIKESELGLSLFSSNGSSKNPIKMSADDQFVHITLTVEKFDANKAEKNSEFKPRVLPTKFMWELPVSDGQMTVQLDRTTIHVLGTFEQKEAAPGDTTTVVKQKMEHYQFSQSLPHPIDLSDVAIEHDVKAGTITISAKRANIEKIVPISKK